MVVNYDYPAPRQPNIQHNRYVTFPASLAGGLADHNCGGKDHNDTPAASSVRGGDRAAVGISKIVAESVNGCANALPVMFPVSGVRAANMTQQT